MKRNRGGLSAKVHFPTPAMQRIWEFWQILLAQNIEPTQSRVRELMIQRKQQLAKKGKNFAVPALPTLNDWYRNRKFRKWLSDETMKYIKELIPKEVKDALFIKKLYKEAMEGEISPDNAARLYTECAGLKTASIDITVEHTIDPEAQEFIRGRLLKAVDKPVKLEDKEEMEQAKLIEGDYKILGESGDGDGDGQKKKK